MAKVPNAVEILPKILTAWVGRTSVTDRQTTDGRAIAYSERNAFEEEKNNIQRSDLKFRRVVEKFEVRIEKMNYDDVDAWSKNVSES